jgi:hypothetical protein
VFQEGDEKELDEEAEWIYKSAFAYHPVSVQGSEDERKAFSETTERTIEVTKMIKDCLNFMRNHYLEVPFITNYRKEHIELNMTIRVDQHGNREVMRFLTPQYLWKIYRFDEKVRIVASFFQDCVQSTFSLFF